MADIGGAGILAPIPNVTFDLKTLNLYEGTHEITVKARASGYKDSVASNAVSCVTVSGTWYFNENPTLQNLEQAVTFTSNGNTYKRIFIKRITGETYDYGSLEFRDKVGATSTEAKDDVYFYNLTDESFWYEQAYRTITFDGVQTVSKEFYEWLVANAVQTEWYIHPKKYYYNYTYCIDTPTQGINITFTSNGQSFDKIITQYVNGFWRLTYVNGEEITPVAKRVYNSDFHRDEIGFFDATYKTIIVENGNLLNEEEFEWFLKVYKKQSPEPV